MINVDLYLENISADELKNFFKIEQDEKIIYGDYNSFVDFLKNNNLCTLYICSKAREKSMGLLQKLINCFNLEDVNIDELYALIKTNGSLKITRTSEWKTSEIHLIREGLNNQNIECHFAEFKYINNWGYEKEPETYKILCYNKNVVWIKKSYDEPQYFIQCNDKIYGIKYYHKLLAIYKNMENTFGNIILENDSMLDDILINNEKPKNDFESTEIDLSNYFIKGFFYKGFLYNGNWKGELSVMKNVEFANGLAKIEIENLTYPHCGYVLLEPEDCKIIEAMKE
jgi:hypothetical protein